MSKKVTSVNLDEDLADQVSSDETLNLSGTVNKLLREYLHGTCDTGTVSMLELREEQLKSDLDSLETDLENKREELSRVQDRLADARNDKHEHRGLILKDAATALGKLPRAELTEDNPAVENWARKADLSESELLDWYLTEHGDSAGGSE